MHAKKQMMQDPRYKDWDKLKTITMQVWVNLPPQFANYLGWKHNLMTQTQMETYLLLQLNRIHDDWVKQLAIWDKNRTMPEEVLVTGYKGYDGAVGIKEYNEELKKKTWSRCGQRIITSSGTSSMFLLHLGLHVRNPRTRDEENCHNVLPMLNGR